MMICNCGYEFKDSCGIYGCPNCLGESMHEEENDMNLISHGPGINGEAV